MRKHQLSVLVVAAFAALAAVSGWGQSNEVIDSLLAEERATLGNTAYLVLTAAGIVEDSLSVEQVFAELTARPWGFAGASLDQPTTLGSLAHLAMRAFGMRGGILYTLFPGRRYAARELVYLGYVPGNSSPGRVLAGREVTDILGRVLDGLGQRSEEEVTP